MYQIIFRTETRNQRAKENNKREDEKYREEIERQKEIQKQKFLSKYGKEEHEVLLNGTCLEKEQISEYSIFVVFLKKLF